MSHSAKLAIKYRHLIILAVFIIFFIVIRFKTRPCKKHLGPTEFSELHIDSRTKIKDFSSEWLWKRLDLSKDSIWKENSSFNASNDWLYFPQKKEVLKQMRKLYGSGVPRNPQSNIARENSKCAVIGNSDDLLQHTYGKFIDQHTHVIRFNKAPTRGYEEFVGTKTTHHFAYPKSSLEYYPDDIALVFVPFKTSDLEWLAKAIDSHGKQGTYLLSGALKKIYCNHTNIVVMKPEFLKYIHKNWLSGEEYPSTGFIGTVFALHHCDQVNLFGFRANCHGKWLHYFEQPGMFSGSHNEHDDTREKRVLAKMESEGIIRIFGTPP